MGVHDERHVYVIGEVGTTKPVKIGRAANAKWRLSGLRGGNPRALELRSVWIVERALANAIEKRLHNEFSEFQVVGEWFDVTALDVAKFIEATA